MRDPGDRSDLGLGQKMVAKMFDFACWAEIRYVLPFGPELMREFGAQGAMRYLSLFGSIAPQCEKVLGHHDTHVLIGISAMWNGCRFCGCGHTLAGNISRFRDDGLMCPLTHHEIIRLQSLKDPQTIERIEELLADPAYEVVRTLARRMYQLKFEGGEGEPTPHDELLDGMITAWNWLNECSIVYGVDVDPNDVPPLTYVGRDKAAVAAYRSEYGKRFPDDLEFTPK